MRSRGCGPGEAAMNCRRRTARAALAVIAFALMRALLPARPADDGSRTG